MASIPPDPAPIGTPPTIAVVGPTAAGKSSLGMALAERLGGELVSCDSVQVYRGFDVGSAKPRAAEQAAIRHHLIDCVDWDEAYDARRYRDEAEAAIRQIHAQGKPAIVVGGTGLYLRALRFGLVEVPPSDPRLRSELEARDLASLLDELERVDPQGAAEVDPQNHVHVVRALEIFHLTGRPASELRAEHQFREPLIPMQVFYLRMDPELLRARIGERTRAMLDEGLVDEVRQLRAQGVPTDCRPMRAVGYAQVNGYLDGDILEAELYDRIRFATAQYAKRQRTWFAKTADRVELSALETDARLDATLREIRRQSSV